MPYSSLNPNLHSLIVAWINMVGVMTLSAKKRREHFCAIVWSVTWLSFRLVSMYSFHLSWHAIVSAAAKIVEPGSSHMVWNLMGDCTITVQKVCYINLTARWWGWAKFDSHDNINLPLFLILIIILSINVLCPLKHFVFYYYLM